MNRTFKVVPTHRSLRLLSRFSSTSTPNHSNQSPAARLLSERVSKAKGPEGASETPIPTSHNFEGPRRSPSPLDWNRSLTLRSQSQSQSDTSRFTQLSHQLERGDSIEIDDLLFILAHPNLNSNVKIADLLLAQLLKHSGNLVLSTLHFNLLLTHTLKDFIDAVQTPLQPPLNPRQSKSSRATLKIPDTVQKAASNILSQMDSLSVPRDGWTYSHLILLNKHDPASAFAIYEEYPSYFSTTTSSTPSRHLQPWAYNSLLYSLSLPNIHSQKVYAPSISPSPIITHSAPIEPPELIPSKQAIWNIYASMKKAGIKPTLHTHQHLLSTLLNLRPIDLKSLRKARSKLNGNPSRAWSTGVVESVMEYIAQAGSTHDLNTLLTHIETRRVPLTRNITDSILTFWSLNQLPEKVISVFKTVHPSTPPTHATYTAVFSAIPSLPLQESDPLLQDLTTQLTTQLTHGSPLVGPSTLDKLFEVLHMNRDLPAMHDLFNTLETTLIPAWKRNAVYGFTSDDCIVVLSPRVVESVLGVFGGLRDVEGAKEFVDRYLGDRSVIALYESVGGYKESDVELEEDGESGVVREDREDVREVDAEEDADLELDVSGKGNVIDAVYNSFREEWVLAGGSEKEVEKVVRTLREFEGTR
ncbi:hypothetical protein HDU79_007882 [Rhizoclosmatium sp. JEL0117]|nr:hypothetical protein HDU79_007882 [Rhizoclosmatium sp. JEL0117]